MYKRFLKWFDDAPLKVVPPFTIEIDSKKLADHTGNEGLDNTNLGKKFSNYIN
jgi:hypothetical protein